MIPIVEIALNIEEKFMLYVYIIYLVFVATKSYGLSPAFYFLFLFIAPFKGNVQYSTYRNHITMIIMSLEGWGKQTDNHLWPCFTRNRHKGRITGSGWGDGSI